jgi:NADPH-dependent curcumin reductase CurA
MVSNKSLIFKQVPTAFPKPGTDLVLEDRPIDLDTTEPPQDGLLIENFYASFDPYQRGRMRPAHIKSYSAAYSLNDPINNSGISKVLKSGNSKFKKDDVVLVYGACPTQEYSLLSGELVNKVVFKLDNPLGLDPKIFLGALGMPGLTAYSSFYKIGEPKKGQTIFISAASGAVGQIVGQLAKHEGLKVIGSVGDDAKLKFIESELGFDGGFNYKKEKPSEALKRLAPEGLDIYYENVGGEQLEAAINAMKDHGRIIACGMISQYNVKPEDAYPVRNLMQIVAKRLLIQGFIVGDQGLADVYKEDHQKNLQKWIKDGSFQSKLSVTEGMDNAAEGLVGMLQGKNFGKAVLTIKEMK